MKTIVMVSISLALCIFFSGCASKSQLAKVDAQKWTALKCSGFLTWNECRQQAHNLCPNGFHSADYLENYTIQRREVSIACKA